MNFSILPYETAFREKIIDVWEKSVRSTHHFLEKADIDYYKNLVEQIDFTQFEIYCVLDSTKNVLGFLGVADKKIEMLFLDPDFIGKGLGKKLVKMAILDLQCTEVEVNEGNHQAVNFYQHFGFVAYDRTEKDGVGKDYPILKMRLAK